MAIGVLTDKVAVITGATGGIGAAIARRFAEESAKLVLAGRNQARAAQLLETLRSAGATADFAIGDVRSEQFFDGLGETVRRRHGRIDTLVLNAGAITFAPTCEITAEQFDEMMDVNVRAPWLSVRALHQVLADNASIVITSSVSASTHFPGETVYCMSEGGPHAASARAGSGARWTRNPRQRAVPGRHWGSGHVARRDRLQRRSAE